MYRSLHQSYSSNNTVGFTSYTFPLATRYGNIRIRPVRPCGQSRPVQFRQPNFAISTPSLCTKRRSHSRSTKRDPGGRGEIVGRIEPCASQEAEAKIPPSRLGPAQASSAAIVPPRQSELARDDGKDASRPRVHRLVSVPVHIESMK